MANRTIRHFPLWLGLIVAIGLTLRLLSGRSGIWMDEAWSALFARAAHDPVGVFFRLNHDNNHHLNTLWLQLVGMSAPPLLMRAPAIVCSTIAIAVAARFARRDGDAAALATAALFAGSPFFVLYGSEARGYALVTLAILLLLAETRDWIETSQARRGRMALIVGLGCFSHLVMIPALVLVAAWAWIAKGGLMQPVRAARKTGAALDLPLITGLACGAFIIGGAAVMGGMAVGAYDAFNGRGFLDGLSSMAGLSLGFDDFALADGCVVLATLSILLIAVTMAPAPRVAQRWLWLLLIAAMPIGVAVFRVGNSEFGRYYILSAIGLMLLLGNAAGTVLVARPAKRLAGILAALTLVALFSARDFVVIQGAHAQPDLPVDIMASQSPRGTTVLTYLWRSSAPLEVASAQRRYPLRVVGPNCAPADYLHWPYLTRASVRVTVNYCGRRWALIAQRDTLPPSTENWALYRRADLPAPGVVASGPRPALPLVSANARAGVAQG